MNHKHFVRGPFHLGAFSFPVAIIAVVWIMFIAIVFVLPTINVRTMILSRPYTIPPLRTIHPSIPHHLSPLSHRMSLPPTSPPLFN